MSMKEFISLVPDRSFHNWLVLAWLARALVTDLADVNRVAEQRVEGIPRE